MVNLNEREAKILEHWKSIDIYKKMAVLNKGAKPFYYLDGPPNAYGLATHHMWVYTIKDIMLKYMRYAGYDVHDRPGFDVHGLPIENRIERKLNFKSKDDIEKFGVDNFIKECKNYVDAEIVGSIELLKRFGVFMDFDNVYIPYRSHYISKGWGIFKRMYEKGLLYRDLKPLAYCSHCGTVLSMNGPEVEYADEKDVAIFVRFKVRKSEKLDLPPKTYLVIWTTTPWTMPTNMAIAVNPSARYVLVEADGGVNYIVAKDRLDEFSKVTNLSTIIKKEFSGTELDGTYYESVVEKQVPLQKTFNKYHKVLMSEKFVTVTEGTGLLHVAPGTGPEDYTLAKANGVGVFSPIDKDAKYTADAGKYAGVSIPAEANEAIMNDLKQSGDLLFVGEITHSYPHCWRCHSKLIFRSTDQWFINIAKMKKKMLKENQKIRWVPEFGQKWFADAIESSPDWCISRQRYWSSPIPIWICEKCGEMEVLGSVEEFMERTGRKERPKDLELHRPLIDNVVFKCKKCTDGQMKRVIDIFDVWYDSGSAHTGSLSDEEFNRLYPVDWITESFDQIRGWFMTLMRTGVGAYGKTSFKSVLIGGWMKDELGGRMHRSHGNAVNPEDIIEMASVDGWRMFCTSKPRWQDLKLKEADIVEANNNVITLHNVSELVKEFADISGLDLKAVKKPGVAKLRIEDKWILSRLNTLIESVNTNMKAYLIDTAVNDVRYFLLEDFSRFYLKIAKQRASEASKGEMKRLANLTGYVLKNLVILASIIVPFSSEYIYQNLYKQHETIFMEKWPKQNKKLLDKDLEKNMEIAKECITALLSSREKAQISLRWPVSSGTLELTSDEAYSAVERLSTIIEDNTNAKKLVLKRITGVKEEVRPAFAKLGPSFKEKAAEVADALKKTDASELKKAIDKDGYYRLHTDKGAVDIKPEHFTVVQMVEEGDAVAFKYGKAFVEKTLSPELKDEALVREFQRRIQMIRKEMNLKKTDKIIVNYESVGEVNKAVSKTAKSVKKYLNASQLGNRIEAGADTKEFEIEGEKIKVSVKKA